MNFSYAGNKLHIGIDFMIYAMKHREQKKQTEKKKIKTTMHWLDDLKLKIK